MPSLSGIVCSVVLAGVLSGSQRAVAADGSIETGALSGVAHVAVPQAFHLQQHGVIVAVDEDALHGETVAGGFALHPQRIACATEERRITGLLRALPGFLVHEAHHQHFVAVDVLDDRGNESIELREVHSRVLEPSVDPCPVAMAARLRATTKNPATWRGCSA